MCDAPFDPSQMTRALPGVVYRALFPEDGQPVRQIERETQAGFEVLDIPLPPDLIGKVFPRRVSPDGRYIALVPTQSNTPLAIWKIGTKELARVMLPDADVDYLNENIVPSRLREQVITWKDNNHLLIQYFDLEIADIYLDFPALATKTLTVTEPPPGNNKCNYKQRYTSLHECKAFFLMSVTLSHVEVPSLYVLMIFTEDVI